MNMVNNSSMVIAVLLSLVVVPLTSFLKRDHWPQAINFMIALVFSIGGGVLSTLTTNKVHSLRDAVVLSGLTLASSTTLFHTYFSGSQFDSVLTKIGSLNKTVTPVVEGVIKTVGDIAKTQNLGAVATIAGEAAVVTNDVSKAVQNVTASPAPAAAAPA